MNPLAKELRERTGYAWQDCITAASLVSDYDAASELLPAIYRKRKGIAWRGETFK